jgi:hypothetical protein
LLVEKSGGWRPSDRGWKIADTWSLQRRGHITRSWSMWSPSRDNVRTTIGHRRVKVRWVTPLGDETASMS